MTSTEESADRISRVERFNQRILRSWGLPLLLVFVTTALTWYLVMFRENYGLAIIGNTVAMWGIWISAINFPRQSQRGDSK